MRPASPSPDAVLFAQLATELTIALKHDRAIGREFMAVFDEFKDATSDEKAWLLALHVGRWRDWNRAHADRGQASTDKEAAE